MFRSLCAHHQEVKIVLYSIWYHHTCRWPSGAQIERGLSQPVQRTATYHVLIIRMSKLYYTAPGIITPVGGRPMHRLREYSQPVHRTATYRCDDTRCCIIQF